METRLEHIKAFILTAALVAAQAIAQPAVQNGGTPPAPPVEDLVAAALEASPSLAAARFRLAAAREAITAAGALPNPMVEVMLQDVSFPKYTVGTMEMSMIGPEVRQEIPYPGKRRAASDVARADAEIRAQELDLLRRQLAAEVRSLYGRVYALDQEREALSAARELLDLLATTAATRYSVGQTEQEAVIKAQLEATRLEERSDDLEAERAALVAALNGALDRSGAASLGPVTALPTVTVPADPWEDAVLASSAAVAEKRAEVAAAERRLDLGRTALRPDFTTGAAVGLRGGFDPVVTLRFGIELPLWRNKKERPLIRAAEHELETARAELRTAEAAARSDAARLRADWERTGKQIVRYREAVLPQSSSAIDAARSSYLAGRGDFSTVVEDFRTWLEARSELARREADRFATWAELSALVETALPDHNTGSAQPIGSDVSIEEAASGSRGGR